MKYNKQGFSLLELILVLLFAFLIVVGVFLLYINVDENVKVENESQFINTLKIDILNFYGNKNSYSNISNQTLIAYNIIDQQDINGDMIIDSLGTNFDVSPYNDGVGFNFNIDGIPQKSCIKMLPFVLSSFSEVNEQAPDNIKPENYADICSQESLVLTYSDIIKKMFHTDIPMNGIKVETFPDKFDKENNLYINGSDFNMTIRESNQGESLVDYISKQIGAQDQIKSNTSSTGYTNSTCGVFSNSSSCGDISVDKILDAIASAPDSIKNGATVTMGANGNQKYIDAICSSFSCSSQLNQYGIPEIVIDIG